MQRRQFIVTTAITTTGLLAGCTSSENNGDTASGGNDSSGDGDSGDGGESEKDIEIVEHELVRENEGEASESVSVQGIVKNVSGDSLSYVEVEAKFYDDSDTLLDSFMDNVNDLGDGEEWQFSVDYPGMGEDARAVASYEITASAGL